MNPRSRFELRHFVWSWLFVALFIAAGVFLVLKVGA